jgi:hypothetical protein
MRRLALVCLALPLLSCTQWSKPGGTPEALAADQGACNRKASAAYPTDFAPAVEAGIGSVQPGYACLPNRGCVGTGANALSPGATMFDKNAAPRDADYAKCMGEHGWSK